MKNNRYKKKEKFFEILSPHHLYKLHFNYFTHHEAYFVMKFHQIDKKIYKEKIIIYKKQLIISVQQNHKFN